jgi:hypothetical protein
VIEGEWTMLTAFALAGLGGNNAHGAGFLAAAQELQRQRQESFAPDALARFAALDDEGARRRMNRGILPELELISCTSGAIASVLTYLEGKDVREETEGAIAELERATWLPRNAYTDPWRSILVTLFTGVPNVFGPWAEAFSAHVTQRAIGFFDRTSPYYGAVPTTYDEFADLWLPARAFVPKRPNTFFDKAAEVLNSTEHGVGVAFNSFDPQTGLEQLYVNTMGMELIRKHHDEDAQYGRAHGRTGYHRITSDGVRNALWLFYYGFPAAHLGPDRYVDGPTPGRSSSTSSPEQSGSTPSSRSTIAGSGGCPRTCSRSPTCRRSSGWRPPTASSTGSSRPSTT